tara:strand:+ start:130 stop:2259 length:2130 start_codon:yes stop_codon:yes gene_type:complete
MVKPKSLPSSQTMNPYQDTLNPAGKREVNPFADPSGSGLSIQELSRKAQEDWEKSIAGTAKQYSATGEYIGDVATRDLSKLGGVPSRTDFFTGVPSYQDDPAAYGRAQQEYQDAFGRSEMGYLDELLFGNQAQQPQIPGSQMQGENSLQALLKLLGIQLPTNNVGGGGLQFMANGGIVTQPTAAIVGERGPEMVMGGGRNTAFSPSQRTKARGQQQQMMMGGNPLNMLPFAALAGGGQINQPMMALVGEQGPELAMLQPGDAVIPLPEGQADNIAKTLGLVGMANGGIVTETYPRGGPGSGSVETFDEAAFIQRYKEQSRGRTPSRTVIEGARRSWNAAQSDPLKGVKSALGSTFKIANPLGFLQQASGRTERERQQAESDRLNRQQGDANLIAQAMMTGTMAPTTGVFGGIEDVLQPSDYRLGPTSSALEAMGVLGEGRTDYSPDFTLQPGATGETPTPTDLTDGGSIQLPDIEDDALADFGPLRNRARGEGLTEEDMSLLDAEVNRINALYTDASQQANNPNISDELKLWWEGRANALYVQLDRVQKSRDTILSLDAENKALKVTTGAEREALQAKLDQDFIIAEQEDKLARDELDALNKQRAINAAQAEAEFESGEAQKQWERSFAQEQQQYERGLSRSEEQRKLEANQAMGGLVISILQSRGIPVNPELASLLTSGSIPASSIGPFLGLMLQGQPAPQVAQFGFA